MPNPFVERALKTNRAPRCGQNWPAGSRKTETTCEYHTCKRHVGHTGPHECICRIRKAVKS